MKVQLNLPDSLDIDHRYIEEAVMALLYSTGKLSAFQACQTLKINRRSFEELLPRYGFSALVDSDKNIDIELNT